MQTISHSILCILLVFCLGCSSLPKAFEQKKSIESVGYFEPKTRQNEYESIVKALGIPITIIMVCIWFQLPTCKNLKILTITTDLT